MSDKQNRQLEQKLLEEARSLLSADLESPNGRRMQSLILVAQAIQAARQTRYIYWSLIVLAAGTVANVVIALCKH
jgi:hypothetical protein